MLKATSLSALFFLAGINLFGQIIPDRFIVEFSGEPAASYAARRGHRAHASDSVFRARRDEIRAQHAAARPLAEQRGAQVLGSTQGVLNALVVGMPTSRVNELMDIPGVIRVHPARLYQPMLDHALPLQHVPDAWNQIGGMVNAGVGMKIGIIDTGIDSSHPGFQDPSLVVPPGFPLVSQDSDRVYTNNKIIVARSYATSGAMSALDVQGHGTGVAMSAAGLTNTGPFGTITGVAPKAYLGNYKVFPDSGGAPTDLIIKAIDDAVADGMDVINLSLGSAAASRPQDDPLVSAVEAAVAAGCLVTIAAGNTGPDPDTINSPGTSPNAISVGSMANDRTFYVSLTAGDAPEVRALPGDRSYSVRPISAPFTDVSSVDASGLACSSLPVGSLTGSIVLILRGSCTFQDKINNAAQAGASAAVIYATSASPAPINMAVGTATLPASMVSNQDGTAIKQQLAGGQVSATLVFFKQVTADSSHTSDFSSGGPHTDTAIKPDLIAVGSSISTATPLKNDGSANDGYVVEEGTSFSAPIVAGAAALLKAARPGLTAAQYRSLLIDSASGFKTPAAIQQSGSGFLNVQAALLSNIAAAPVSLNFGSGTAQAPVNGSLSLTLTNLSTNADTFSISVVPLSGGAAPTVSSGTIQIAAGQSQALTVQLTAASLDPGTYQGFIQVQGGQSPVMAQIPYWYALASGVPAHITILNTPSCGDTPSCGKALTRQTITLRVTDAQGLATSDAPTVSFTTGNGSVVRVVSIDSDVPGAFQALVRLGSAGVSDVIHFQAGGVTKDVTISVQ